MRIIRTAGPPIGLMDGAAIASKLRSDLSHAVRALRLVYRSDIGCMCGSLHPDDTTVFLPSPWHRDWHHRNCQYVIAYEALKRLGRRT